MATANYYYRDCRYVRPSRHEELARQWTTIFHRVITLDFCRRENKRSKRNAQYSSTTCDMSESSFDFFSDDESTDSSGGEQDYSNSFRNSWKSRCYQDSWRQAVYYQQHASWQRYHNSFQSPTRQQASSGYSYVTPSPHQQQLQDSFARTSIPSPPLLHQEDAMQGSATFKSPRHNQHPSRPRLVSTASSVSSKHRRTDLACVPTPEQIFRPSIIETRCRSTESASMLTAPSLDWDDHFSVSERSTTMHHRNTSYCSSSSEGGGAATNTTTTSTSTTNDWSTDWLTTTHKADEKEPIYSYMPVTPVPTAAAVSAVASIFTAGWTAVLYDRHTVVQRAHLQFLQLLSGGVLQLTSAVTGKTMLVRPSSDVRVELVSKRAGHCLVLDTSASSTNVPSQKLYILPVHLPPLYCEQIMKGGESDADKDGIDNDEEHAFYAPDQDTFASENGYAPSFQHDAVIHLQFAMDAALTFDSRVRVRGPRR